MVEAKPNLWTNYIYMRTQGDQLHSWRVDLSLSRPPAHSSFSIFVYIHVFGFKAQLTQLHRSVTATTTTSIQAREQAWGNSLQRNRSGADVGFTIPEKEESN